jgi:serine/threonine protein kinase
MYTKGQYKIGDFGLAKKNTHQNIKNSSLVGTPLYMAPEILKSERYTSKCDIWSIGIILYELLHGLTPWDAGTEC